MEVVFAVSIMAIVLLALLDLWVGVTNDAANFLNSAIGARVARRKVILIVAASGVLFGALFSSGMMEVARKGVFDPDVFLLADGHIDLRAILAIYLGVMAADVILLDLFNTLGLPTSTTVSIVSELVGASIAVNLWANHTGFFEAFGVINGGPVAGIYSGIFISVIIAFTAAAIIMFLLRTLFTHDLTKTFPRYGWIWVAISFSVMAYFVLFKGLKGASFVSDSVREIMTANVWLILGTVAALSATIAFILRRRHETLFNVIILGGTGSLAMAFAGNDLVNFIGPAVAAAQAVFVEGIELSGKVPTPGWALFVAGGVMVLALARSKKARTVSDTEVRLASQGHLEQRFAANGFANGVVRASRFSFNLAKRLLPASLRGGIDRRTTPRPAKNQPPYDRLRATVNLTVASCLIAIGTANKLPLSTTYITFTAAMGASLADRSWDARSAPARFTGMLTVLGGWVMTGCIAAAAAFVLASVVYVPGNIGVSGSAFGLVLALATVLLALVKFGTSHARHLGARRTVVDDV